jgi:hypothetical protein
VREIDGERQHLGPEFVAGERRLPQKLGAPLRLFVAELRERTKDKGRGGLVHVTSVFGLRFDADGGLRVNSGMRPEECQVCFRLPYWLRRDLAAALRAEAGRARNL